MRAVALGLVLCGLAFISGSDRSLGQQPKPKPPRTLENLIKEPAAEASPAQEPAASVDLLAVPSEAEVAEAVILIRDAYADGYKGEPSVLMKTLKFAAGQTDDAVRKFALLQEGEKAAVQAGDPSQAFELLEKRGSLFKIDVPQSSIALIKKFTKSTSETTEKLVERLLQLSRTALEADRLPFAKEAVELGVVHARALVAEERVKNAKGDGVALLKEVLALQKDITQRCELFGDYEKALATLQKADAGACEREHTVVGRYRCLASDDWETGLAYLAKGEAGPLRVAASKELLQKSGEKQVPKELLVVAGEWWKLSEKPKKPKPPEDEATEKPPVEGKPSLSESDLEKLREHSSSLYADALPHLIDPIDRALATKRSAGSEGPSAGKEKIVKGDKKKIIFGRLEADGDDCLYQTEYLTPENELTAGSRNHALRLTKKGSLVLYNKQTRKILWSVGFEGSGASLLIVQDDGNIVLSRPDGVVVWSSDSHGGRGSRLCVQDDGNLVVYVGMSVQWATMTQGQ